MLANMASMVLRASVFTTGLLQLGTGCSSERSWNAQDIASNVDSARSSTSQVTTELETPRDSTIEQQSWSGGSSSAPTTDTDVSEPTNGILLNGGSTLTETSTWTVEGASSTTLDVTGSSAAGCDDRDGDCQATSACEDEGCWPSSGATQDTSNPTGCEVDCPAPADCGDGVLGPGEQCDQGVENDGRYGGCNLDCSLASFCGDGVLDTGAGELCDDGDEWDINGCTATCERTPGLQRWHRFNETSGHIANDELGGEAALVKWGRRWNTAPGFEGGFVASPEQEGEGFVRVVYSTGEVDPTDSAGSSPIQYVDLGKQWPSPEAATLSLWARRVATTNAKGLLLWMGSDGDGAGGTETVGDGWSPNHEIWMRYEGKEDATKYGLSMGVAASHIIDISGALITPKPDPVPPETKCSKSVDLEYGQWHHLVLTFRNLQNPEGAGLVRPVTKYTAYVNGAQIHTKDDCHSVNLERFTAAFLGRAEFKSNNTSWLGDIDDFMQFGTELTAEQVAALYEAQRDGR